MLGHVLVLCVAAGLAYCQNCDTSCHDNEEYECPTDAMMQQLERRLDLVRLQFRGFLDECSNPDPYYDMECEAPVSAPYVAFAVTSEGGNSRTNPPESLAQNSTTTEFSMNGVPIGGAPNWQRGLNFVTVDRSTSAVTTTRNFDLWSNAATEGDIVSYINDQIPEDSVVLVSVHDTAVNRYDNYKDLMAALGSLGLRKRFGNYDSYALVGYKARPGLCGRVPDWISEAYALNPTEQGRDEWTPPVTAYSLVPKVCTQYPTNVGFEVTVVAEGDNRAIEYEIDAPESPSLFLVNGVRVPGAPWYPGLNVVVLDATYRTIYRADHFDFKTQTNAAAEEQRFASFVESLPSGSVVLVTMWEDIKKGCGELCVLALTDLGGDLSIIDMFRVKDQYSLIGYKGTCEDGNKPSWVTDQFMRAPGNARTDQDGNRLYGVPMYTTAQIPYPLCS